MPPDHSPLDAETSQAVVNVIETYRRGEISRAEKEAEIERLIGRPVDVFLPGRTV